MKLAHVFFASFLLMGLSELAQAQYKLTLNLSGFTPHSGQALGTRVVDKATGDEVGRKMVDAIPGDALSLEVWALLLNHSYYVDLFADFNGNGMYDPPPVDHAWRVSVDNVTGHTEVNVVHSVNFTDIGWPDPPRDASVYAGTWTGTWHNLTYGTQGDITAVTAYDPMTQMLSLHLETAGVFGDPAPVSYDLQAPYTPGSDSVSFSAPDPWTGTLTVKPGDIDARFNVPSYGLQLHLPGNFGPNQLVWAYFMTGTFTAEGIVVLTKTPETGVTVHETGAGPVSPALLGNYPNPFNPETSIHYYLPDQAYVKLTVYNLSGEPVAVLTDGIRPAGENAVRWNAAERVSGAYFYKLETGNSIRVKKMILTR